MYSVLIYLLMVVVMGVTSGKNILRKLLKRYVGGFSLYGCVL